jgi:hypothetical protein
MVVMVEIVKEEASSFSVDVCPIIVALDADNEAASELIIAADLPASNETTRVPAERSPCENETGRVEVLLDPDAADVAANVAAGPAEDIDRRRRNVDRSSW